MSFVYDTDGNVSSFAEYQDVLDTDQRIFDENEGLSDSIIDSLLVRATERLLSKFRSSQWWRDYYLKRDNNTPMNNIGNLPELDTTKIIGRHGDFTDLCVYSALSYYILPKIANFGDSEKSEFNKISFYQNKADELFGELITFGDWYDFDGDGTIQSTEVTQGTYNLRRVR